MELDFACPLRRNFKCKFDFGKAADPMGNELAMIGNIE